MIEIHKHTKHNNTINKITIQYHDDREQLYQTHNTIKPNHYIINNFTIYNTHNTIINNYYSYQSNNTNYKNSIPINIPKSTYHFNTKFQPLKQIFPKKKLYKKPPQIQINYLPLTTTIYNPNNLNKKNPYYLTPTIQHINNLNHLISIKHILNKNKITKYRLHYNKTNSFTNYTNPKNNHHKLIINLTKHITTIHNTTTNKSTYIYNNIKNIISKTNTKKTTTHYTYNNTNHLIKH